MSCMDKPIYMSKAFWGSALVFAGFIGKWLQDGDVTHIMNGVGMFLGIFGVRQAVPVLTK